MNAPRREPNVFYKLRTSIPPATIFEDAFHNIVDAILRFTEKRLGSPVPPAAWQLDSFSCEHSESQAECISLRSHSLWTLRLRLGMDATWDFAIIERDGNLQLGIVGIRTPGEDTGNTELLKMLSGIIDLKSELPFGGNFASLSEERQIEWLWKLLASPERNYPVIAVSELNQFSTNGSPYAPRFSISPNVLAARLYGSAGVVMLNRKASMAWLEKAGREWAVYDGAVRTFYPGFDPMGDEPNKHPLTFKNTILEFQRDGKCGPEAFLCFLEQIVARFIGARRIDFSGLFFIDGAKYLLEETSRFSDASSSGKGKSVRDETLLEKQYRSGQLEIARLKRQLLLLKQKEDKAKAACESEAQTSPQRKTPPPPPEVFMEIIEWARRELAGKIFLHQRAERGLAKAQYRSPELIRQALLLLATDYRDSRMGLINDRAFKKKCRELGLSYRRSIERGRAGAEGDSYFVSYPPGEEQRQFLKFKLSKGKSHQKRYCLRIYFFWDDESRQVVVGSLPHHLSNRTT